MTCSKGEERGFGSKSSMTNHTQYIFQREKTVILKKFDWPFGLSSD